MIATLCSSVKRASRIAPSESGASLLRNQRSEIPGAAQPFVAARQDRDGRCALLLPRGSWAVLILFNAPPAHLRALTRLAAPGCGRTTTQIIVVGDGTDFLIAHSEVDGSISRTVAANHRGEIGYKGIRAPCLTNRVNARAHALGRRRATVVICRHHDPIDHDI